MSPRFAIAVCTRNRADMLARTLDALDAQRQELRIVVVDQSPEEDRALTGRAARSPGLDVIRDPRTGLSRARNLAARHIDSDWIVYVDDDCLVEPGWAEVMAEEIDAHPQVSLISGSILAHGRSPGRDYQPVSLQDVEAPAVLSGMRSRPWEICFGVSFAVRRSVIELLGGWDERLGPGVDCYPASDDMDFNYRFQRAGEIAYVTPRLRVRHDQWRTPAEVLAVYQGYSRAWAGFSMKHLRTGDVAGGLRLWWMGLREIGLAGAVAVRRRSRWRAQLALGRLRGHLRGTVTGLRERW